MNLSFRFVLEKSDLHFMRAAGHAPNVDPTRPATGAGRPDRFPSLRLLPFHRTLHGLLDLEPRSTVLTMVFCCNGCSLALV